MYSILLNRMVDRPVTGHVIIDLKELEFEQQNVVIPTYRELELLSTRALICHLICTCILLCIFPISGIPLFTFAYVQKKQPGAKCLNFAYFIGLSMLYIFVCLVWFMAVHGIFDLQLI